MQLLTATDLDDWSGRRDAEAHLPTLVRRLIMATAVPLSLRISGAEGIRSPGFDGVLDVPVGVPPFVPAGRSVWEMGTGKSPNRKAQADYKKRTDRTPLAERATTTFVLVTSRTWGTAQAWATGKAQSPDGWGDVLAFDAQDLATWLETCPGVAGWLASEHLGRQPFGITALRDWFADWAERTEPPIPPDLLLCGRADNATELLAVLDGRPREYMVSTRSRDEAVAFIAGVLLPGPVSEENAVPAVEDAAEYADASDAVACDADEGGDHDAEDPDTHEGAARDDQADPSHREALLERTVVVHDDGAWRRWIMHEQPLTLIPLFDDPSIDPAIHGGHHVLLPRVARAGDKALPPVHRGDARAVWERVGIAFPQADELARASRRSLTSLRRRIGRVGRFRRPAWADSPAANLLAPLLLAGAWTDDVEGDREVVTALSERTTWRSVARDLAPLTSGDDAPIVERQHRWEFVDIVDAWDALNTALTSEDLNVFHEQVISVLAEPDPALALTTEERHRRAFSREGLPSRRYSGLLRRGMANTIALLGAVAGDHVMPGGRTGEEHAATAVMALLDNTTTERWMSLADLLPVLAEAAPNVFLDAVEESMRGKEPSVMALFKEEDALALSPSSRHTPLLWALEALALSPQHVSRVAVVLGQLAQRDPGGRLANRPAASLQSILHLLHPQSAVNSTTRLQVVDAVRRATPTEGWGLLLSLVKGVNRGLVLHYGPRFRDWRGQSSQPTYSAIIDMVNELGIRMADDAGGDGERWASAMEVLDKVPPAGRERMLQAADDDWTRLDSEAQRRVLEVLDERVSRHTRFREAAWALDDETLQRLRLFLEEHAQPGLQPADYQLFSWWPRRPGMDERTEEGRAELAMARADTLRRALAEGLDGVVRLAEKCAVPASVGSTLAAVTDELDSPVLDLLGGDSAAGHAVAQALARARSDSDPRWLRSMINARPAQAVHLLLTAEIDDDLLSLLEALTGDQRAEFWHSVHPWRVPGELTETVCEQLLAHGRPVSAISVLEHAEQAMLSVDLAVRALRAAATTSDERLDSIQSPTYLIGQLLDKLEEAGLRTEELAQLEWLYSPAFHDERNLSALNRSLAADPEWFAQLVALVYKPDPTGHDGAVEEAAYNDGGAGAEQELHRGDDYVPPHLSEAAWNVLREWRSPQPGSPDGSPPSSQQMQVWVDAARQALQAAVRTGVASLAIGEALSGPATDREGTWPSKPVRDLLEHEQNGTLEDALVMGRFNQRGVTVRGPYDGGNQERRLAAEYRGWADKVRHDWPRAGAVLDELARIYEADARREDASSERHAEM